ncbi:MAG: GNAT family N-acetyltransferase [Anaerolineae bacterium]
MKKIEVKDYAAARPIFEELADFNESVDSVLANTAPGEIYVDDLDHPQVGFAVTPEGHYLAGEPAHNTDYRFLKEIIPPNAYLVFTAEGWVERLGEIWSNPAARRHDRCYFRFQAPRFSEWRQHIPSGFTLTRVDQNLLSNATLKNYAAVVDWVDHWHSADYFLQHGFGYCLIEGDTIASWCLADCVNGPKCEIGIMTDGAYRRRGLAAVVVSAAVDYCATIGIKQIGWHCLKSNRGSAAVAEKVGFVKVRDYFAYSWVLPTESPNDLTPEVYRDWALHYESFVQYGIRYNFRAAEAWALAGDSQRAIKNLQQMIQPDSKVNPLKPEWLEDNWMFDSLRGLPAFEALIKRGE